MNCIKLGLRILGFGLYLVSSTVMATVVLPTAPSQAAQVCNGSAGSSQRGIETLRSNNANVGRYVIKIELRYEKSSGSKWARGCIPSGTSLYLKDSSGRKYSSYTAQVHGWNFADKLRTNSQVRACAKHPNDSREFCTSPG
jgi:FlaG/FlaF family flagellin (archaellin)